MLLSEGQMSDYRGAALMLKALPNAKVLIADKGYDADWFRDALAARKIAACIPPRASRKIPIPHDLHDPGLVPRAMAEISIQHAFDLAAARENRVPKLLQVGPAFGQRGGAVPKEGLALPGKDLIEPAAGFDLCDGIHGFAPMLVGRRRTGDHVSAYAVWTGTGGAILVDGLQFRTAYMIVGASDLGEGNLGARTGNLEDGTEFAFLARYGYGGRLTFSESAREAHRRAGLVVRNRCDNPIAVMFAGVVNHSMKTAEIDALACHG